MPIYEYACKDCGHQFETLVRSDSRPECPSCHSTDLDKLLSVFATTSAPEAQAPFMPGPCGACEHAGPAGTCAMH